MQIYILINAYNLLTHTSMSRHSSNPKRSAGYPNPHTAVVKQGFFCCRFFSNEDRDDCIFSVFVFFLAALVSAGGGLILITSLVFFEGEVGVVLLLVRDAKLIFSLRSDGDGVEVGLILGFFFLGLFSKEESDDCFVSVFSFFFNFFFLVGLGLDTCD